MTLFASNPPILCLGSSDFGTSVAQQMRKGKILRFFPQ